MIRAARRLLTDAEFVMRALAGLALVAALFAPGVAVERAVPRVLVVIDVTQSMNATDVTLSGRGASRLALAKAALHEALDTLPCGAQLGFGVFTEYRTYVLMLPLEVCAHRVELRATLDNIDGRLAWAGASEVAKGLHSALRQARQIMPAPAVVFITDGHEAPPLNARHRPRYDGKAGEVGGTVVGVGGDTPVPIPKLDLDGRTIGVWAADEVMQTDPYSQGRTGSVAGERLVETEIGAATPEWHRVGDEHLTYVREPYLRVLAEETGLGYQRLARPEQLPRVLLTHASAPITTRLDATPWLLALALAAMLAAELIPRWRGVSLRLARKASVSRSFNALARRT